MKLFNRTPGSSQDSYIISCCGRKNGEPYSNWIWQQKKKRWPQKPHHHNVIADCEPNRKEQQQTNERTKPQQVFMILCCCCCCFVQSPLVIHFPPTQSSYPFQFNTQDNGIVDIYSPFLIRIKNFWMTFFHTVNSQHFYSHGTRCATLYTTALKPKYDRPPVLHICLQCHCGNGQIYKIWLCLHSYLNDSKRQSTKEMSKLSQPNCTHTHTHNVVNVYSYLCMQRTSVE